ncbi:MAG: tRNA (N6-isopentenyl adenosine(37)-C2)-methylthiotransferase MiaB [Clostridia bacterium]|nr:tRNA (N6-isopentenyl adenosine(37)-C2)-methylthiotransferase MiaB [Clostridia bacterium]
MNTTDFEVRELVDEASRLIRDGSLMAHVITFGCQQNEADSERIRGMLVALGYSITDKPEDASLIIVNTCAVREHAETKALSLLGRLKEHAKKRERYCIGLVGCAAAEPHVAKMIKSNFKYVSFTLEPAMLSMLPELVARYLVRGERSFIVGQDDGRIPEGLPAIRQSKHKAWVSVMYGCNNFCSYCIVPYTRGRERSRRSEDVINECRELIDSGVREITLLGQNVNSYRSDMDFATLLERIALLEGDFIIRFMTSHPKDASSELIRVMAKHRGKIAPYFHLPLQSGSDSILAAMNRTYNRERYLSLVDELRRNIPGIAITSDIIVGFPGESEEDFLDTLDMLRRVRFDAVYAFIYSKRRGTPAAEMENQVPENVKHERINKLLKIQEEISEEQNAAYLGRTVRVLVEKEINKRGQKMLSGRSDTNKPVHITGAKYDIGEFAYVKITEVGAFDLYAEPAGNNEI